MHNSNASETYDEDTQGIYIYYIKIAVNGLAMIVHLVDYIYILKRLLALVY